MLLLALLINNDLVTSDDSPFDSLRSSFSITINPNPSKIFSNSSAVISVPLVFAKDI